MIKVQSKQGLTPYFSMERAYKAEDIIFDVHFISYICKTNYSLKVKVNFVKELLLLILDKNKPAHSIIEPLLVTQVVFERLQDEALIKALSDHLQKHFRLYSSKFEVETTRAEDSLKLILKIPATIINNHWETLLKANSFGNNPAFFVDFMKMMLDILSEYRSKLQEYVTQKLIRQMLDLIENVDLMLSLIIKIQSLAQELLPQKINLEISACLHEYQSLKSILHNQFILVLSDTIDKYFSFDQNIEDKGTLIPLIAECISKKFNFLDFLKYKVKQSYDEMRDTDYRIPVLLISIKDELLYCLNHLQYAILVFQEKNNEDQIHDKFKRLPWVIIEAVHFSRPEAMQILFVQCINSRKLDLHGFNLKNSQILTERFLKFQFLNFKLNTSKISVGKASHSPNKKSVLGPGIESLLRNLKNRYPGFISSCEDYSQETGLVTTNFYSVIFINIGQPLTQNIISSYDALRKKIKTDYKIAFLDVIRQALNKNSIDNDKICRVKVVFNVDLQYPELISHLKENILASKLYEMYPNIKLLTLAHDSFNTDYIQMVLVPSSIEDFIPDELQHTIIGKKQNKDVSNSNRMRHKLE